MQIIDSAIIVATIPVKNNSNIVKMLTKSNGLQLVYLSSGLKKNSVKSAVLQPLSICMVRYVKNKNSSLPNLKEAKIESPLLNIQLDIFKSTIALFIADFLNQSLPEDHEEGFYEFVENALKIFNEMELGILNFHLSFLLKIGRWFGVQPTLKNKNNNYFDLKEGIFLLQVPNHPSYLSLQETQIFVQILSCEWTEIGVLKLSALERRSVLNGIINYYIFQVPGFKRPKSLNVLEEVFN